MRLAGGCSASKSSLWASGLLENEQRAKVRTTSSMGSSAGAKVCAWAKAETIWVFIMVVEGKRKWRLQ
jgi:hypothetical protein